MLVSPAEPAPFKNLGKSSVVCERYGADFLMNSPTFGLVGVQRKTIADLIASLHDGRVSLELGQQKGLGLAIWMIEGTPVWSNDGVMIGGRSKWTRAQHYGTLFSINSTSAWVMESRSLEDSMNLLLLLEQWMSKSRHGSLNQRPKVSSSLGTPSIRETQIYIMQGFPGVGYEKAKAIVKHYGGLPMTLLSEPPLTAVTGIGTKLAASVASLLQSNES